MCELVQELGMHYKMKPEALANNVVFTIGECLLTLDSFFFLLACASHGYYLRLKGL